MAFKIYLKMIRIVLILIFNVSFVFSQNIYNNLSKNEKIWVDSVYVSLSLEEKVSQLFIKWYLEKHLKLNLNNSEKNEFQNILERQFNSLTLKQNSIVLRDFHVDNLIYLDERDGINQLGLIDYQDALVGSSVYDFTSLIEDVRHPIQDDLKHSLVETYSKLISVDQNELKRGISFYSIQRNLKIIGIFSRLKYRDDKKNYFPMIEVAWGFIKNHLKNNEYKDLNNWINNIMNNSL